MSNQPINREERTLKERLHILQHSLGVDKYGHGNQYRNHFATGPGNDDFDNCCSLVEMGLMQDFGTRSFTGDMHCFVVTPAGIDYVALNSPKRPPEPKLTASQKRYRDYIESEYPDSYAEYIGITTRCESDYRGNYRYINDRKRVYGPYRKTMKEAKAAYKELLKPVKEAAKKGAR